MEATEDLRSNVSMEMSTVVLVKNRCQFCYAFFKDPEKIAEHSNQCEFRFSETFEAFDGKLKFACAVCFDVFQTRGDHKRHERLHKFPGGFQCSDCVEVFLNNLECVQHMEGVHKVPTTDQYNRCSASTCFDCGALFEQETHLRLHIETNCGKHRTWSCIQCNLLTEEAYKSHMEIEHKFEFDETDVFVLPKVEVALNQNESLAPIVDITKAADSSYIEASNGDPLLLVVEEEPCSNVDFQSVPDVRDAEIILSNSEDEDDDDVDDDDDNSIEKSCGRSGAEYEQNNPNYQRVKACAKKFSCKYCGRRYATEENMRRHMLEHGPDRDLLYKCDCCFVYFMTRQIRDTHREAEHKEKLTCKKCNRTFLNIRCLQAHNRAHHKIKEKEVTCLKCGIIVDESYLECHQKSYCVGEGGQVGHGNKDDVQKAERNEKAISESNEQVKPHKESLIGDDAYDSVDDFGDDSIGNNVTKKRRVAVHEKKHVCSICDKKYYNLIRLQQHIVEHGPDGSLVHRCDCCPLYFESRELRDEHTRTAHKEKLTCSICVRTFINARALNGHKRIYHKGDSIKRLVCAKCGNSYRNFTYLSAHEQSDCGRLPIFKCDVCSKFFSTPFSLSKHKEIHSGVEKKFPCNLCEKRCRNSTDLRIHQRSHTGEKPYQCSYCNKRFTDVSYMKAHMTMHVGVKRHVCYGCGDRFITNSALHKHRKYRKDTCALVPIKPPLEMKKVEISA